MNFDCVVISITTRKYWPKDSPRILQKSLKRCTTQRADFTSLYRLLYPTISCSITPITIRHGSVCFQTHNNSHIYCNIRYNLTMWTHPEFPFIRSEFNNFTKISYFLIVWAWCRNVWNCNFTTRSNVRTWWLTAFIARD